ncbi:type VI secretion protein, VC_A0114 family [Thiorhodococcus drewsii AZ1]|uniref:Type VI secretion protein, VC_A0114 family n=1 Tax=Thiorhodococcus drewsii AZ1 TaxID=765913 RepID=G2E1V8_9GAMM|nr:type VI secretion system baseplate subunit TssK [Thiorhodococcus drewsii]EGV31166.1 type VI secretion protein, VC_A0114 family [Thiorhodococcus drewsii AZ1]
MTWDNRVLWTEGMFLQPQHFQQHDRYLERLVALKSGLGVPYAWGLRRLRIDEEMLAFGKFALVEVAGVLPDGTPFDAPASDPLPPPLEFDESVSAQTLYLALPLRRPGAAESGAGETDEVLRFRASELSVRDNVLGSDAETLVDVGRLDLRLMSAEQARDGYACCGVARVSECRADRQLVLDPAYIAPCVDARVSRRLADFVEELTGLLHRQADSRAGRVRGAGRGGVADWADFLLLQVLNRAEPVVSHLSQVPGLHPEALYRYLLGLAGDLATFASDSKRPPDFPTYRHEDLDATFTPLIARLREYLGREYVERAIAIEIKERQFGFSIALVDDRSLLAGSRFVLAAQANLDSQALRNRFPTQVKIGPLEKIQELVKLALPGIPLRPMSTAPLEIPFHAGFDYFELDRSSEFWKQLASGGGFGLHIGGDFPELQMELWAIRE